MNKYEVLYIIRNDIEDDQKAAVADKFATLVQSLGGTVESVDKWGTKKFAYTINNNLTEGYYVLMTIEADASAPQEIDRNMRNDEKVIRCMITAKS
jgi:small subunit ribosomal protein S6